MKDESTDLAVHKHLSICARYVVRGNKVTSFLAYISLADGKVHIVVHHPLTCLEGLGLSSNKNGLSLATDGAAIMIG